MKIAINKLHFPVTTLGFGRRVGIWTQGCSIRCPGCLSRDTWAPDSRLEIEIEALVDGCKHWLGEADGVTVSGGEPFDQAAALDELIIKLRMYCRGDLLVYSGYSRERLLACHQGIIAKIDVLVSDPYRADAGSHLALRGSDNQRITLISDVAHKRYPTDLDLREWGHERHLDVVASEDGVWMAGIPRRGEMDRIREQLRVRGFTALLSDEPTVRP